jgi:hypothetical protein
VDQALKLVDEQVYNDHGLASKGILGTNAQTNYQRKEQSNIDSIISIAKLN